MPRHLGLGDHEKVERAVIAGDPDRIKAFADHLGGAKLLSTQRGYVIYVVTFNHQTVHLVSHGIGSPSLAICAHELMDLGLKKVTRIGSAGTLVDDMGIGDLFIPTAAYGEDGVSRAMLASSPVIEADATLTAALYQNLSHGRARVQSGLVLSSDIYYSQGIKKIFDPKESGAKAIEMECAALFAIARARGVKASAALAIDGNPTKWTEGVFDNRPTTLWPVLIEALEGALKALTDP